MQFRGKRWLLVCGLAGVLPMTAALAANNAVPSGPPVEPLAPMKGTIGDPSWTTAKLHRLNQMEISFAKLEQQKGQAPRVKDFAGHIVQDHQGADRQVMAYAKKHKVDLTAQPVSQPENKDNAATPLDTDDMAMQAEQKKLESLKGPELDREFLSTMISGHDKAIELVRTARGATSDRDLAALLDQLAPALQKHRDMAATLNNALYGTSSVE